MEIALVRPMIHSVQFCSLSLDFVFTDYRPHPMEDTMKIHLKDFMESEGLLFISIHGKGTASVDYKGKISPFWSNPWAENEMHPQIDLDKATWIKNHKEECKTAIKAVLPTLTEEQLNKLFAITNDRDFNTPTKSEMINILLHG